MIIILPILIELVLLVLNVRVILSVRRLVIDSRDEDSESFLLRSILYSNLTTTVACAALLALLVTRQVYGVQAWTPPVYYLVIIWLLAIPVLRDEMWRRQ